MPQPKQLTRSQFDTHCKTLQLKEGSVTLVAITKQYRKLTLQSHPDRNPDNKNAELFNDVCKARDELNDHVSTYGEIVLEDNDKGVAAGPTRNAAILRLTEKPLMSLVDALDIIISSAPKLSNIQLRLLDTLVKVVGRFNQANYASQCVLVTEAFTAFNFAIDTKESVPPILASAINRIDQYFKELKETLIEYENDSPVDKNVYSAPSFQRGLHFIQEKMKEAQTKIKEYLPDDNKAGAIRKTLDSAIFKRELSKLIYNISQSLRPMRDRYDVESLCGVFNNLSGAKPEEELDACITTLLDRCENYHDLELEYNKNTLRPVLIELIQFVQRFFPTSAEEKGLKEQLLGKKPTKSAAQLASLPSIASPVHGTSKQLGARGASSEVDPLLNKTSKNDEYKCLYCTIS